MDLYDSTNTNFIARNWTDVNGQIVLSLDSATYSFRLFAYNHAFSTPETLVVSGDTTVTYQGQSFLQPLTPTSPTECIIFGAIVDAGATPIAGADVEIYSVTPQDDGTYILGPLIVSTITDVRGYFELQVLRDIEVSFKIDSVNIDVIRTVPDAPWQWYTTWAE